MSSVSDVPLIKFTSMDGAFGNFTDSADYEKFFRRTQYYTVPWLGLTSGRPNAVWYDFWWDIPHRDRFGRWFDKWEVWPGP